MLSSWRVAGEGAARPGAAASCAQRGTRVPGSLQPWDPLCGQYWANGTQQFSPRKLRMEPFFPRWPRDRMGPENAASRPPVWGTRGYCAPSLSAEIHESLQSSRTLVSSRKIITAKTEASFSGGLGFLPPGHCHWAMPPFRSQTILGIKGARLRIRAQGACRHRASPTPAGNVAGVDSLRALFTCSTMSAKSAISKEIFAPLDERMLGAVQVKRRTKKKIPFLATGGQGEYLTYICLSVTNKKPTQASITKVKQFEGSTSFVRRSQWMLEQLRQVNGIDPNGDSAEFDLLFENAFDQWVASTASEKCTFFQILHHTCQRYLTDRKPEFINCQSKIMGGNSILHSAADSVTSAVQKASQALNERGERLGRAEEKTEDLKNSAQQFAETAHKLAMKHKC
nr:syntaxin-binding protein 6 isoform X1 [Aotus nancymaae]